MADSEGRMFIHDPEEMKSARSGLIPWAQRKRSQDQPPEGVLSPSNKRALDEPFVMDEPASVEAEQKEVMAVEDEGVRGRKSYRKKRGSSDRERLLRLVAAEFLMKQSRRKRKQTVYRGRVFRRFQPHRRFQSYRRFQPYRRFQSYRRRPFYKARGFY